MEEEKDINWLPDDILGQIFAYVILDKLDRLDMCLNCNRPYYWIVNDAAAVALRSTCRGWRGVMLHKVLIKGMLGLPPRFCFSPVVCTDMVQKRMRAKMQRCRNPFFRTAYRYRDLPVVFSDEEEFY